MTYQCLMLRAAKKKTLSLLQLQNRRFSEWTVCVCVCVCVCVYVCE